jgi:hypothetical protein
LFLSVPSIEKPEVLFFQGLEKVAVNFPSLGKRRVGGGFCPALFSLGAAARRPQA